MVMVGNVGIDEEETLQRERLGGILARLKLAFIVTRAVGATFILSAVTRI